MHVMIDLETLSTRLPDAAIASIGAVVFYPTQPAEQIAENPMFSQSVVLATNQSRHIDGGTVAWWLSQSEAARNALLTDAVPLPFALNSLAKWLTEHQPKTVWANSPSFDCVLLRHAFDQHGVRWPFNYWDERCLRTIKALVYPHGDAPRIRIGAAHGAVADAVSQAVLVAHCYEALKRPVTS